MWRLGKVFFDVDVVHWSYQRRWELIEMYWREVGRVALGSWKQALRC